MKRASSRLGSQALTLSLLSSMVLLAACGGGGKDEPAAAAPAAVPSGPVETPQVPDPKVSDLTAADEPYIVAVSSVEPNPKFDSTPPTYQISILDGKLYDADDTSGVVLHKIALTMPPKQKWLTINTIERSLKDAEYPDPLAKPVNGKTPMLLGKQIVEVNKGANQLYYILPTTQTDPKDPKVTLVQGTVHFLDLTRRQAPKFESKQVSNLTTACELVDSYPLKLNGSATALLVTTGGPDQNCSTTADNTRVLITSADDETVSARTLLLPNAKLIKRLYQNGELAGVLMQEAIPNTTPARAKLTMLSATQDDVLLSPVKFPTADPAVTFTDFPNTGLLGSEWLGNVAGSDSGEGYLRLQGSLNSQIYRFVWSAADKSATLKFMQQLPGVEASISSLNDMGFTYFSFNNVVYRGPIAGTDKFEQLYNLGSLSKQGFDTTIPPVPRYQTASHIVFTQGEPAVAAWAVTKTKTSGTAYKLFQSTGLNPVQLVGQRGKTLVVLGKDSFDTIGMGVATLEIERAPDGLSFAQVHNIELTTPIWSNTVVDGVGNIDNLIVRAKGGGAYNTVDLVNMKYGISLGGIDGDQADSVKVVPSQRSLSSLNNRFDVTMELYGNLLTRQSPWLFNVNVPNSLKQIDTWAAKADEAAAK